MDGEITEAYVEALAAARGRVGGERFAPDEPMLVDDARTLAYRHFVRALAYWEQRVDPDGVEDRALAQHAARRLQVSQSFEGTWFLDGVFDPIAGEVVNKALRDIEGERFKADWAQGRERVGDLRRTPAQRRADALVEMARRARAMPAGGRLPEPLFTVLVGYETFAGRVCELASGTVVAPGAVVPWLNEAWVERVVFDGPDRVKNVGVRRRIFSGATRRAVEVRDGSAPPSCAKCRPMSARSTTWFRGRSVARRLTRTEGWRASTTTGGARRPVGGGGLGWEAPGLAGRQLAPRPPRAPRVGGHPEHHY